MARFRVSGVFRWVRGRGEESKEAEAVGDAPVFDHLPVLAVSGYVDDGDLEGAAGRRVPYLTPGAGPGGTPWGASGGARCAAVTGGGGGVWGKGWGLVYGGGREGWKRGVRWWWWR